MLVRLFRLCTAIAVRAIFRVRIHGLHHYHAAGSRVLIVANHVSKLDGALLYLFLPEPPVFAVNRQTARRAYMRLVRLCADIVELDPLGPIAIKSMIKLLREDRKAAIFPEGRISETGALMKVYDGPGMIADHAAAMVLPVGIEGPQHSVFSTSGNRLMGQWFPRITLRILAPRRIELPAELQGQARRAAAAEAMMSILREVAYANAFVHSTLFEAVVGAMERHGRRRVIAQDSTGATLSFRQLHVRAFILGALIAAQTRPGERVGIMLPSTAAALVCLLGMLARGRIPALLNFTAGEKGLITACETAGIRVAYTSRSFVEAGGLHQEAEALRAGVNLVFLEDLRARVSVVDKLRGLVAGYFPRLAFALHNRAPDPEATAVILFTSGSEGIPKGVALSHRNLLANRSQVKMLIDLSARDVVLNLLPMFHAFGLLGGVLLPLLDGTRTYHYPSPLHYRLVPELCYELGVTVLFATNTFLNGYARYAHPYDFHRLRFLIAGAERVTEETRRVWADRFGIRILEGYGATEASPVVAVNTPMENRPGSVGQILTGIEHYLEPVEGVAQGGRLVIRGPNVMQGYLFHGGDGEIMPPWTERGRGWYDTGDIVVVDEQRFVTILGRQKRFANLGGEMVPLASTEDLALFLWPNHRHAAVAVPDSRKGEQIVLATEYPGATRSDLVAGARELRITELAIPKKIVHVAAIPLLGSGKVNFQALRDQVMDTLGG